MTAWVRAIGVIVEDADEVRVIPPDDLGGDLLDAYRRLLLAELASLDLSLYPEEHWYALEPNCHERLRCWLSKGHAGPHAALGVEWDDEVVELVADSRQEGR